MTTFMEDRSLANLPLEVHQNPTVEGIREFLRKEIRTQKYIMIMWGCIGFGIFLASLFSGRESVEGGTLIAGMSFLVIVMVFFRMKKLQLSDDEIADKIRQNEIATIDLDNHDEPGVGS